MVLHVTGLEEPLQALEAVTVAPKPIWTLSALGQITFRAREKTISGLDNAGIMK
jgi:hypothetical protein